MDWSPAKEAGLVRDGVRVPRAGGVRFEAVSSPTQGVLQFAVNVVSFRYTSVCDQSDV